MSITWEPIDTYMARMATERERVTEVVQPILGGWVSTAQRSYGWCAWITGVAELCAHGETRDEAVGALVCAFGWALVAGLRCEEGV